MSAEAPGVDGTEVVHLDVPAISGRLRLIRLAVVGLATEYGADVDDLEDVRIATGEICTHLVSRAEEDQRLSVRIQVSQDPAAQHGVLVEVRARVDGLADPGAMDELSDMVLATTASEHGATADDAGAESWFRRALRAVAGAAPGEGGPTTDG